MSDNNKYDDLSAIKALRYARKGFLLLPDIQRKYVWEMDEIEALFESIIEDYPIGSCIFWKTNKKTINEEKPNLYHFLYNFEKDKSENDKIPECLDEEHDYYIVLDGQQRITSLNIALYGSYKYFKGGRGYLRSNSKSWIEKELYYNLDFYNMTNEEKDEEDLQKRFCFLTKEEAENKNYFKVKNLLAYESLDSFLEYMINENYDKNCRTDLSRLFKRLHASSEGGLIHFFSINEKNYDSALDIFVRVNSTGRKLSKSDLLFSTLIDGWKEGKDNIDNLVKDMNAQGDGFNFSRDYIMRACLVLVGTRNELKITSLDQKTIHKIRNNWKEIYDALFALSKLLKDLGYSDKYLTSYNATMPIVYYLYNGGQVKSDYSKREIRKFLSVSMAKRLFGIASNAALDNTTKILANIDFKKTDFSLGLFSSVKLTGDRTFTVDEANIDSWLDTYKKGKDAYILLTLLYPHLKLNQNEFHQDHCHPHVYFENKNISSLNLPQDKVEEWQIKRNLLPNLQFLEGGENSSKNDTPLEKWIQDGKSIKYQPENISFGLENFEEFFAERRKLMKEELMRIFEIL